MMNKKEYHAIGVQGLSEVDMPLFNNDEKEEWKIDHGALTKREYFAVMALQGLLANSFSNGVSQPLSEANKEEMATLAVGQADALIGALNHKALEE